MMTAEVHSIRYKSIYIFLAFKLADEGYHVWLVNFRGSEYSRRHRDLNSDGDSKFWNITFHEMMNE